MTVSTPRQVVFLIAVPLAWAVVLLFHAGVEDSAVYADLRDEVNRWLAVHLLTLAFVGLMGAALYLLIRDLSGTAAKISRLAIGPLVLFYGAGEGMRRPSGPSAWLLRGGRRSPRDSATALPRVTAPGARSPDGHLGLFVHSRGSRAPRAVRRPS